jgi:hypothetical protein
MSNPFDDILPGTTKNPFDDLVESPKQEDFSPAVKTAMQDFGGESASAIDTALEDFGKEGPWKLQEEDPYGAVIEMPGAERDRYTAAVTGAANDWEYLDGILNSRFSEAARTTESWGVNSPEKAMNILAMSHAYGVSPSFAAENYEALNTLRDTPEPHKFIPSIVMGAAGVVALPTVPLYQMVLGIAGFEALGEAGSVVRSKIQGKPYEFGKPFSLAELAPDHANELTKTSLELLDIFAKGKALHSGYKGLSKAWDALTIQTLTEAGIPQRVYVDPDMVRNIFKGVATPEEMQMWRDLGVTAEELRAAKHGGFQIEIPTDTIVTKMDQPWFGKVKEALGFSPYVERTVIPGEGARKATPVGGLLEEPGAKAKAPTSAETPSPKPMPYVPDPGKPPGPFKPAGVIPQKIADAATRVGVNPETALAIAAVESGYSPTIKNPKSSAAGIFQFIDSTWRDMGGTPDDRSNIDRQIDLGVKFLYQNTTALTASLGRPPQAWELYIAHQQGAGGAAKLLKNPEAKAVDLVDEKAITLNGGTPTMTAGQFTSMWRGKFERKLAQVSTGGKPTVATPGMPRQEFIDAIGKNTNIAQEMKDAFVELTDARAASWAATEGSTPEEWYSTFIGGVESGGKFTPEMLAQESAKITETPEFKNWFGESKVVDESGKPLTLYHVTGNDFKAFDPGYRGASFFSTDPENAFIASRASNNEMLGSFGPKRTIPVHVKSEKLYGGGYVEPPGLPDVVGTRIKTPEEAGRLTSKMDKYFDNLVVSKNSEVNEYARKIAKEEWLAHHIDVYDPKTETWTVTRTEIPMEHRGGKDVPKDPNEMYWMNFERGPRPTNTTSDNIGRKALEALGYDGAFISDEGSVAGAKTIAVWETTQIKSIFNQGKFDPANPDILAQNKKGAVQFLEDGKAIIHLFETADVSTLIHELGHIFRKQLSPEDLNIAATWAGAKGGEWSRKAEEKFARGFEAYLAEGIAPSPKLRSVFQKLKAWLLEIYKSLKNLRVRINDDVRAVFDRLLSTEAERKANVLYQMDEEYSSKPVPAKAVKPKDITTWDDLVGQILLRAQDRAFKKVAAEQKREMADVRREGEELWKQFAEEGLPRIVSEIKKQGGISVKSLSDWDSYTVTDLVRRFPGVFTKKSRYGIDEVAADYGYESADALVQEIQNLPTKAEFIESHIEEYEKYMGGASGADAAERLSAYLEEGIQILYEKVMEPVMRPVPTGYAVKTEIRKITGQVQVGVAMISESHALKAAIQKAERASKEAFRAGKMEEALKQKERAKEALDKYRARTAARKEVVSLRGRIKKAMSDLKVPEEYRVQMAAVLQPFGLNPPKLSAPRKSLEQFVREQEEGFTDEHGADHAGGNVIMFKPEVIREIGRKSFNALTVEELGVVSDVIDHLRHVGRAANEFMDKTRAISFEKAALEIANGIYDVWRLDKIQPVPHPLANPKATEGMFEKLNRWHKQVIKPEIIFRLLDANKDNGPVWTQLWRAISNAESAGIKLRIEVAKKLDEVYGSFDKATLREWNTKKEFVPGTGFQLTKWEQILFYCNTIHPDNLKALRYGFGIDRPPLSDDEIRAVTGMLSPEEITFANRLIDEVFPILKPHLEAEFKAVTGVSLKMVERPAGWASPTGIPLPREAYFPIRFDPRFSEKIADAEARREAENLLSSHFGMSVEHGFAMERKGGKLALLLDPSVITRHLDDTNHYATHMVALRDTLKLLSHPLVRKAITETVGEDAYRQLKPWIKEVARPGSGSSGVMAMEAPVGRIRRSWTAFVLGMRVSTSILQPFAVFNAVPELGMDWVMSGVRAFASHPREQYKFMIENDPFMAVRVGNYDRDVMDVRAKLFPQSWVSDNYRALINAELSVIGFFDLWATGSTWHGAYLKAMAGKVDKIDAGDHQASVEHARGTVGRTQTSGLPKDLSAVQRGGEAWKTFIVPMYSFMNTTHNLLWSAWQEYSKTEGAKFVDLVKAYWWLLIIPAIMQQAVQEHEKPKDFTDAAATVGKGAVSFGAGGIPIVRDIVNAALNGMDYRAGAFGALANQGKRFVESFERKRKKKERIAIAGLKLMGIATGLPPDQAIIALEAALDVRAKPPRGPMDYLFRPKPPERGPRR